MKCLAIALSGLLLAACPKDPPPPEVPEAMLDPEAEFDAGAVVTEVSVDAAVAVAFEVPGPGPERQADQSWSEHVRAGGVPVALVEAAPGLEAEKPAVWVAALAEPDEARWVEAQMHLIQAGVAGLKALERGAKLWKTVPERARAVVLVALAHSVPVARLKATPKLHKLVKADLADARTKVAPIARAGARVIYADPAAGVDIKAIGPAVVPALIELTRSKDAATALRAALVLRYLPARAAADSLRALARDKRAIDLIGDDFHEKATLGAKIEGEVLPQIRDDLAETHYDQLLEWLGYGVPVEMTRALAPASLDTVGWQGFWRQIRPVWNEYHDVITGAEAAEERAAAVAEWKTLRDGFVLVRETGTSGVARLEVTSPAGATVRLVRDGEELEVGPVPLRFDADPSRGNSLVVEITAAGATWSINLVTPTKGQRIELRLEPRCLAYPGSCAPR